MPKVTQAYVGSFDGEGRLTLAPAPEGTVSTDLDTHVVSVLFSHVLTDDQKSVLKVLGQAFCGQIGGAIDHSGNGRHMWPAHL